MKRLIFTILLLLPEFVFPQYLIKGGVRNAALGGTGVSSSTDLSSALWNPALLGLQDRIEILTDQRKFFWNLNNDDLKYNFLAIGFPLGTLGTLAASATIFNGANYNENKIGIHYGKAFFEDFISFGIGGYFYNKGFGHSQYTENDVFFDQFGYKKSAFDFDFGITVQSFPNTKIGLVAQNILRPNFALNDNDSDRLPLVIGAGFSYRWNKLLLVSDFYFENYENSSQNDFLYGVGIEYELMKRLSLRLGKDNYNLVGGFGLKIFSKEWTDKFFDPFSSTEFINIKGFDLVLDYCVQYPISGIISSYGDHFLGVRINFFNSTTEVEKLTDKVPPKIETKTDIVTEVKIDTVYVTKVKIDTVVKERVLHDTIRVYDRNAYQQLMQRTRELSKAKSDIRALANWNRALRHLLSSLKLYYSENYQAAIDECKSAIQLAPQMALAYIRLGSIYYRLGQYDLARRYWQIAYRIEPDNPELKEIPTGFLNNK